MTSKSNTMPGGMGIVDSPQRGEHAPKQPTKKKHSHQNVIAGPPESMTVSALGVKYGLSIPGPTVGYHTRSRRDNDSKSGDNKSPTTPWIPPGNLQRTASSESRRVTPSHPRSGGGIPGVGIDQPEQGGDLPSDLDQPGQGGDRSKNLSESGDPVDELDHESEGNDPYAENEEDPQEINTAGKVTEGSSPAIHTSEVSAGEIEEILEDEPELPVDPKPKKPRALNGWTRVTYRSGYRSDPDQRDKSAIEKRITEAMYFPPWAERVLNNIPKEETTEDIPKPITDDERESLPDPLPNPHPEPPPEPDPEPEQEPPLKSDPEPEPVPIPDQEQDKDLRSSLDYSNLHYSPWELDQEQEEFNGLYTDEYLSPAVRLSAVSTSDGADNETDPYDEEEYLQLRRSRYNRSDRDNTIRNLSSINASVSKIPPNSRSMKEVQLSYTSGSALPWGLVETTSAALTKRATEGKPDKGKSKHVPPVTSHFTSGAQSISTATIGTRTFLASKPADDKKEPEPSKRPKKVSIDQETTGKSRKRKDSRSRRRKKRSSSPSSGNSSSGSSRRSRNRRRRRRHRHHSSSESESGSDYDRGIKMKFPETYDGKADIDVFDEWAYSVVNYARVMKVRDQTMIRIINGLVSGKAKDFYMTYVANKESLWALGSIFPAIFDYCFPKNIMRILRRRWDSLSQGKRSVQEYARDIEKLARKFPEINERMVVLKFWKGLNSDLRQTMVLLGADPEINVLNEVIAKALESERSREERDDIAKEDQRRRTDVKHQPKREWTRFKNRTGGNKHFKPGDKEEKPSSSRPDKVRANAVSPQNTPEQKFKPKQPLNKLSRNKLDALRAEGRCFNCREVGHEQRNCPKLNSMRPPKPAVKTGSISIAKIEKLAERKEKADLYVGSISMVADDPIAEQLKEFEELEFKIHRMCETAWGEDPLWYNEETRPDCKYSIHADETEVTIWDFHWGQGHLETSRNMSGTLRGEDLFTCHVPTRHISSTCVTSLAHSSYM